MKAKVTFETLVPLFADDREITAEAIQVFIETFPALVNNWEDCIAKQLVDESARACHAIKGAISVFGFSENASQMKDLENQMRTLGIAKSMPLIDKVRVELSDIFLSLKNIQK